MERKILTSYNQHILYKVPKDIEIQSLILPKDTDWMVGAQHF